jgi:hypothetical protein
MAFEDPFNSNNAPTDDNTSNNFHDGDPAAEFLEREKRELGGITGNDSVNSFEDPFASNNNSLTNGIYHHNLLSINEFFSSRCTFTSYKYRW